MKHGLNRNKMPAALWAAVIVACAILGCTQEQPAPAESEPSSEATPAEQATPGMETVPTPDATSIPQTAPAPEVGAEEPAPETPPSGESASNESAASDNPDEAVAAKVGDEVITRAELEQHIREFCNRVQMSHAMQAGPNAPPLQVQVTEEDKQMVLNHLIDSVVLYGLAKKAGHTFSDKDLDAAIEQLKKRFPSEEVFARALKEGGMTPDGLRERLRIERTIQPFLLAQRQAVTVTDEEVTAEYEKGKSSGEYTMPENYDVAHVLVKVDQDDEAAWTAAKEKIDAARARIVAGEDFAAVAKAVSDDPGSKDKGGQYDGVSRGQMVPEFEKQMLDTPVGELSEPFKTQYGWHILKVIAKHEPQMMEIEKVSDIVRGQLTQEKQRAEIERLIAEAKKSLTVEIFPDVVASVKVGADAPEAAAPNEQQEPTTPSS